MNKKVFAFDMDQTLLNSKDLINESSIKSLLEAKSKGHILVICTGRSFGDVNRVTSELMINPFNYYVCNNGTYLYDVKNNSFVDEGFIDKNLLPEIKEKSKINKTLFVVHTKHKAYRTILWDNKEIYKENFHDIVKKEYNKFNFISISEIEKNIENEKITQLSYIANPNIIIKMKNELSYLSKKLDMKIANEIYLDFNTKNTNKYNGLVNLSQYIGKDIDDFIAFGDSGNDIEMLKNIKLSFCMENGTDEAKRVASRVIGTNNSNAIANKILELI